MKICTQCNVEKSLEDYPKSYLKKVNGSPCGDGRRANCRSCENKRRKSSYDGNLVTRIMMNTKARAREIGCEFSLNYEDITIPEYCPILGVRLATEFVKTSYNYNPSIDRINPTKGYVKGNIKIISFLANRMKSNATKEECLNFAKGIVNYFN